jgi:predicted small lipoprotein YifL
MSMTKTTHRLSLFAPLLLIAGCGSVGDLRPAAGQEAPPAAYAEAERPSAEELITPSTQALPARSAEALRRSERRQEDKFDLPPE